MAQFHDYKTESRFSFAINAGWNARLAGKPVTDIPAPKTNEPELEAAAHAFGWMRADACESERMERRKGNLYSGHAESVKVPECLKRVKA